MRIALLLLSSILFWNCHTTKTVTRTETAEEASKAKVLNALANQSLDYSHLRLKARVDADFGDNIPELNATLYSEKNEKIWLNISKFGPSFARGIADKKEFQAYVKLDKSYYQDSYTALDALLGLPFLDLNKLEKLLFGRFMFSEQKEKITYRFANDEHQLQFSIKVPSQNAPIQILSRFGADFLQSGTRIEIPSEATVVDVTYSKWVQAGGETFPTNVKILIKNKDTKRLELDYSNFEFEKMETPFRIPNGYSKKEIN